MLQLRGAALGIAAQVLGERARRVVGGRDRAAVRRDGHLWVAPQRRRLGERLGLSEERAMQLGDFLALQRGVVPSRKAIDINTASVAELERLPGIGPELAARVVAHREDHGAFTSIHGLEAVTGIGPATVKAIQAHLAAEEP